MFGFNSLVDGVRPPGRGLLHPRSLSSPFEYRGGLTVTFEGLAQGHTRSSVSTFRLQLTNPTPRVVDSSYCLLLIGGGFSNQLLFERRFLEPASSISVEIVALIPQQIAPGAYELGLLLPGQMYLGTTIYVESDTGSPLPTLIKQPTECAPVLPAGDSP